MPREIKTTVYTFDELSDDAKETAREWYRNGALNYDWWNCTYEDAANVGLKITAFENYRYVDGRFTKSAVDVAKSIQNHHGDMCETHKTATSFLADEPRGGDENEEEWEYRLSDLESEFLKALCEDYRIMLDHECEYLMSDECVDESILANEYTFTINGKREG